MDQHVVPQPSGSGAGEQEAFGGVRTRAVASLWNPCLGMGRQIRPCVDSFLLAVSE